MEQPPKVAAPIAQTERIRSLDVMRGFALLGILVMNIQSFSMIQAAYFNPTAYGDLSGINEWVWILSRLFADQKFMTIFTILFGAGIVLMATRAEATGRRPAGLHLRRMAVLLLFGLIHGYGLWYGEILALYAMCGLIVYWLWRRSAVALLCVGLLLLTIGSGLSLLGGWSMSKWPAQQIEEFDRDWRPPAEIAEQELAAYRGGWLEQMDHRVDAFREFHTVIFFVWGFWRAGGLMLIGMALFKFGLFRLQTPTRFAWPAIIVALVAGIPIVAYGIAQDFAHNWDVTFSFFFGGQFNYWGSLLVSLGWIGLILWFCEKPPWKGFGQRLAAVGQMALTNYLMHTLICTTLFYGHGFGLFGHVERHSQILIVFAIWALQLWLSPIWLRHFRFGPAEWLWRTLTYMRAQPFRRQAEEG